MSYKDLRGWLEEVDGLGALLRIDGADWDLEIGTVTEVVCRENKEKPSLLFDRIKGYPPGYRVLTGLLDTIPRLALTAGLPGDITSAQFVQEWRRKTRSTPIPPIVVSGGPVMENEMSGSDIDLFQFPVPRWHEEDGGRYIGTASLTITKDPDSDWVNVGTYRVMVHDKDTLGFYVAPGHHGNIHRDKYFARGEPCPVAISFGQDPLLFVVSALPLPPGVCEYDIAGAIRGEPVEVIRGELTGLPIPASAEVVIEGISYPGEKRIEGPFGEFTGYYASGERPEPFIKVKRILYRNNPIITGAPPLRPPSNTTLFRSLGNSALVFDNLERAGVPDVRAVWQHEAAHWAFTIVSIKQRYPGHARQAGLLASQVPGGVNMGRYVIVVDDDIDPSNMDEVIWAMATRSDPERSVEILRRCLSTSLDPALPPGQKMFNSRLILDACKPYEWLADFPKEVGASPSLREQVRQKWGPQILARP
ncbi:MAG: UbiD family decarboxylase [Dehalococcoidia bacterium]|nr:UbiD family decarboxylase [Dehalococcoidia bacterium]